MKTINFPYIALALSSLLLLLILKGSEITTDGTTQIPLLTLLVFNEFSFFVTAIGAYIGLKECRIAGFKSIYALASVFCLLFSIGFMLLGIKLWPL
jgi:hypothetical protein